MKVTAARGQLPSIAGVAHVTPMQILNLCAQRQNQQQPFCFFFLEAFSAFFSLDFSFFSFFPEAFAFPGDPGTAAAAAACGDPGTAGPAGAGCPLSCAISSGVSWTPAASFANISWETLTRAGAAATASAS